MKKTILKVLALIMALLMVVPVLFACGNTPEESESEQGKVEDPKATLELIKNGKSDFVIVINRYAQFINDKAAYMIQDAVKAISGVEIPLAKDYDLFINSLDEKTKSNYLLQLEMDEVGLFPGKYCDVKAVEASYDKSAPYEILIGDTDRPESARAIADLKGENEYILRIDGNKIVLVASSNKALIAGAEYFVSEYLSAETTNLTIEDPKKSATIEVVFEENPEVFFGMTQTEVDEAFGELLDGLFTGKTEEVITVPSMGESFFFLFADIYYEDGVYHGYFNGPTGIEGDMCGGYATSTDGFNWTYQGPTVRPIEVYPEENGAGMTSFCGIFKDDDDILYLVYESSTDKIEGRVGLSVSFDDGETWVHQPPILTKDQFPAWCRMNIGTPDIYKKDGVWYVTFHGWGNATKGNNGGCQIGVAFGENLRKLDTSVRDPIIPTKAGTAYGGTTGRRDIFYCDGYYYMVYEISTEDLPPHGYGGAYWTHMFARSKDMINWEITEGPQLTQSQTGFGYDGTGWCVIDGELYVFMRNRANNTTAVKLVAKDQ